jgi:hypothetical protein
MYVVSGHEGGPFRHSSGSRDPAGRLGRESTKSAKRYKGSI